MNNECYIIEVVRGSFPFNNTTRTYDANCPPLFERMWVGEGGYVQNDKRYAQRYTKVATAKGTITKCLQRATWCFVADEQAARDRIASGSGGSASWLTEIEILEVVDVIATPLLKIR